MKTIRIPLSIDGFSYTQSPGTQNSTEQSFVVFSNKDFDVYRQCMNELFEK
jgi:hypothetical protein